MATLSLPGASTSSTLATVVLALLASACGSSSKTETITAPSASRCAVQVTTDAPSFPAAGGPGSLRVAATRDCQWAARTDAAWITIAQPTEGQGDGSVRFSVGTNGDATSRLASFSVNDQHLDISQSGKPCELNVSSNRESIDGAGGNLSVNVRASGDTCQWTAVSGVPWITIVSGREGRGNGTVTLHVEPLTGPPRNGSVTIAGQTVQVDQGTGCTSTVSPDAFSVDAGGGDRQVAITAPTGCTWTAESRVSWITIASGAAGSGTGTAVLHVAATEGPGRTGTVIVAGRTITVAQSLGCSYSIAPSSLNVGAQAASTVIQVDASGGCGWTATSAVPWISIASGASGSGQGQVQIATAANDGPARTGTITIAGRSLTVTQSPGCSYSIAPSSLNVSAQAASTGIQVNAAAGCGWTAASAVPWITIASGASGSGQGQVQIATAANDGPARTGAITIAGRSLAVAQASGCIYSIAPASQAVGGDGGSVSVSVTTGAGCSWTSASGVDWIVVASASGDGAGQVSLTIKANASPPRTGTVTIAGRPFTVTQASLCTWAFAPPLHEFPASGGNGNVLVIVTGACSWTAVPNVSWIRVTAGDSGVGSGLLQFTVPANAGAARTGLIAIAGENYVVRQSGAGSDIR